jgi:hypothetical protein
LHLKIIVNCTTNVLCNSVILFASSVLSMDKYVT